MFPRPPFPPPGPCGAGSPASPVLRRSSDSLPPVPTPFVSSGAGTTGRSLLSLPSFRRACFDGPGLGSPGRPHPGSLTVETTGPRRFLRDPMVHAPCSTTPVGPPCQAITALRCCRRTVRRQRLPRSEHYGAPSHGPCTRCLRFAGRVTPTHARLASGCWPDSARRDWLPAGSLRKVSGLISSGQVMPSSFRRLTCRTEHGSRLVTQYRTGACAQVFHLPGPRQARPCADAYTVESG